MKACLIPRERPNDRAEAVRVFPLKVRMLGQAGGHSDRVLRLRSADLHAKPFIQDQAVMMPLIIKRLRGGVARAMRQQNRQGRQLLGHIVGGVELRLRGGAFVSPCQQRQQAVRQRAPPALIRVRGKGRVDAHGGEDGGYIGGQSLGQLALRLAAGLVDCIWVGCLALARQGNGQIRL